LAEDARVVRTMRPEPAAARGEMTSPVCDCRPRERGSR
jgi:hypothetical protein